jgi:ribosomal protein L37AE/L43A/cell division protein FtsB
MGQIKKRQCPSCGGSLIEDSEKQIYRCASCGSSYDYDYFREEQLHEMGETYLSRGEVEAAVDAYRLILKKTPHDFLALRGLMLAAAYLKDMDGLSRIGDAKHFSYDSKLVSEVLDSASEEDKEYFSDFAKIYVKKQKQIDCNMEIKSLHREHERQESYIRLTDNTRYEYYFETKHGHHDPEPIFIAVWCLTIIQALPLFHGFIYNLVEGESAALFAVVGGLVLLIGLGVNYLIVYPKIKKIKKIDADISDQKIESEATARKISELEAQVEELSDDIRKAIRDLIRIDRRIVPDSVKEQVSAFGKIKQHQCPSCGGSLRIDNDKQMYHCTFCGSTYDYEYFREDRIHEAGETYLSRGEFMATTEAYEFMLKKDPHDFLALRGLMLAAAHLTDMKELDQDNNDFDYDSKIVSRVIENASEEDKKYFTEFAEVYAEKKRLFDYSEEMEALLEEKDKINSVIVQNSKVGLGEDRTYDEPITGFIAMWVGAAVFMLMALVFAKDLINAYASNSGDADFFLLFVIFFGAISLILIVLNIISYYPGRRKIKKMQKANSKLYDEVNKIDDKIRELEKESSKLTGEIRRFVHDFVRKDRLIMRDKKS